MSGTTCACNLGYFDDGTQNSVCSPCHYSCLTCSSTGACSTCNSTDDRELNLNCLCKVGFFDSYTPGNPVTKCSQCLPEC